MKSHGSHPGDASRPMHPEMDPSNWPTKQCGIWPRDPALAWTDQFHGCLNHFRESLDDLATLIPQIPLTPGALTWLFFTSVRLDLAGMSSERWQFREKKSALANLRAVLASRLANIEEAWSTTRTLLEGAATTPWDREVIATCFSEIPTSLPSVKEAYEAVLTACGKPPGALVVAQYDNAIGQIEKYNLRLRLCYVMLSNGRVPSISLKQLERFRPIESEALPEWVREQVNQVLAMARQSRDAGQEVPPPRNGHWRIIMGPQGRVGNGVTADVLEKHCRWLTELDMTRIREVVDLKPTQIAKGIREFDGYLAFVFDDINLTVLESGYTGQAMYLLDRAWQSLSTRTRSELLEAGWPRIVHRGDWAQRLRKEVAARRSNKGTVPDSE